MTIRLAAITLAACGILAISTQAQAGVAVTPNIAAGALIAALNPAAAPAGTNRVPCSSSVDPYPVVLVNGTFSVMQDDWGGLGPHLVNAGYCVYSFNYGGYHSNDLIQAVGPVANSAQALANFVAQVKAATGAAKVDLVGHSQGGMLTEYYAKVLHGAPNIHSIVALSPTTHGTTLDGITKLAAILPGANAFVGSLCPACTDQEKGSAIINTLDNGPIAQAGVKYTVIETINETVVTPVGSSFINEPGVTNLWVQNYCPLDLVDHASMPYDNTVIRLVQNALTPSTAKAPNCWIAFPAPAI